MEKQNCINEKRDAEKAMERLRALHDEAFHCISEGMVSEERGQDSTALQLYLAGREKLLEALQIKVPQDSNYDSLRTMQAKMQKHLEELKSRISSLQREGPRNEAPPAYTEVNGNVPLRGARPAPNLGRTGSMMSEEIFAIPEGVFLFQVSSEGRVSSPQPSTSLQVMCLMNNEPNSPTTERAVDNSAAAVVPNTPPPAFLQVGSWVCPLVPGQTIVLKTGYGAYMFPDLANGNEQGYEFVGIILPSELSVEHREVFEHLLVELTLYKEEEQEQQEEGAGQVAIPARRVLRSAPLPSDARFSHKLSDALVTGAGYIGNALSVGTQWTGYWVQQGAQKLRERIVPEDRPVKVDPRLQTGLKVARDASGVARKCSGFLVGKLSEMTFALAQHAAPHVKYYGNKLLVKSGVVDSDAVDSSNNNTVMDDICVVASGGVQSFSVLYMSLETAARQLASCLASETVQVVHHKYGSEASEVVDHAVSSLGNLALATNNIRSFGVKAIAKRTAKDTGKAVLNEYIQKHDDDHHTT